jgi:hypothetical protein
MFFLSHAQNINTPTDTLDQACPTYFVVWATLAKFGLHAGNMKFNTQNEE